MVRYPSVPLRRPSASSSSDSEPDVSPSSTESIFKFWFGIRRIVARGITCNHHPNVVFLDVAPSIFDLASRLILRLPQTLQSWLESSLPELFIPKRLVLKREKVGWEEEFDNEKKIYQALTPVQGHIVPRCFGEVRCARTARTGPRALLLSDIGGVSLHRKASRSVGMERLENMLWTAFRGVTALNVAHDDHKLTNYRLVGDRVMLLDFDSSYLMEDGEDDPEHAARCDANFVAQLYHEAHGDWRPYYARLRAEQRSAYVN